MAKEKFNRRQTKRLIPALKGFNKIAKVFIKILQQKVEQKEKKVHSIKLLVNDMPTNFSSLKDHGLVIRNLGSEEITVKKHGKGSYKQKNDWGDIPTGKKGVIL